MTPTRLVVDLGGVACRWVPERRLTALATLGGLPEGIVDQAVFGSGLDDAGERGLVPLDEFIATMAGVLGIGTGPDEVEAMTAAWAAAYEPNASVLRAVTAAGCPTALFTNNGPLLEAALPAYLPEVAEAFDHLVFSSHLGATKPDEKAFGRAAARLDVDPAEVFFVDDSASNVEAALAAGWQAHHFTTVLDLQAAMTAAGLRRGAR